MEDGPEIQQRRTSKYPAKLSQRAADAASDNKLDIFRPDEPPEKHFTVLFTS